MAPLRVFKNIQKLVAVLKSPFVTPNVVAEPLLGLFQFAKEICPLAATPAW